MKSNTYINTDPADEQEYVDKRVFVIYVSPVEKKSIFGNQGEKMELIEHGEEYSKIRPIGGSGFVLERTKYLTRN